MKVATILGAGVMGSAMTLPFADRGMAIRLVGTHLDEAIIDSVMKDERHPKLNVKLPDGVKAFHHGDFASALDRDTDLLLIGVSSAGVDWAIDKLAAAMRAPVPVLMITKGLAPLSDSFAVFPDIVAAALLRRLKFHVPVAAIGGPCIAGELAVRRDTGTTIVSRDLGFASRLCTALATDYYHPRPSIDLMGVEICAAFKNFYAIAVGWAHGSAEPTPTSKAHNNNGAAILFDQALREMMELTRAFGGASESVWGMAGAGDLYVTCQAGRNSRLGHHLGRGMTYSEVKQGPMRDDTIEGADLARSLANCLDAMVKVQKLVAERIPLALALVDTLVNDAPLQPPWSKFHRA